MAKFNKTVGARGGSGFYSHYSPVTKFIEKCTGDCAYGQNSTVTVDGREFVVLHAESEEELMAKIENYEAAEAKRLAGASGLFGTRKKKKKETVEGPTASGSEPTSKSDNKHTARVEGMYDEDIREELEELRSMTISDGSTEKEVAEHTKRWLVETKESSDFDASRTAKIDELIAEQDTKIRDAEVRMEEARRKREKTGLTDEELSKRDYELVKELNSRAGKHPKKRPVDNVEA